MGFLRLKIQTKSKGIRLISPDTFFLGIIAIFTGILLPLIRNYFKTLCTRLEKIEDKLTHMDKRIVKLES